MKQALDVIMRLAAGEFEARAEVTGQGDEPDALAAGINMLAEELADRLEENQNLVAELQQKLTTISAQHDTILSLSTPALPIWEGVLVLPIIGVLDTGRAQRLTEDLLGQIEKHGARVVIIDVTGITLLDTAVASHLVKAFQASKLLGAQCILTGLSPANAQTMTKLGVGLEGITTRGSLRDGLRTGLSLIDESVAEGTPDPAPSR